jgi:hypothetical protein
MIFGRDREGEFARKAPPSLGRDVLALGIAYARQERRYGGLARPVAKELDRSTATNGPPLAYDCCSCAILAVLRPRSWRHRQLPRAVGLRAKIGVKGRLVNSDRIGNLEHHNPTLRRSLRPCGWL